MGTPSVAQAVALLLFLSPFLSFKKKKDPKRTRSIKLFCGTLKCSLVVGHETNRLARLALCSRL